MVPPDLESLTQDLLPWLAVSTQQLCSLFVSRWFDLILKSGDHLILRLTWLVISQGRLRHGFHFTLKSIVKETAVTFVTEKVVLWIFSLQCQLWCYLTIFDIYQKVAGTLVSPERPFAAQGDWLQVIGSGLLAEYLLDISVTPGIHLHTYSGPCSWELLGRVPCGHFQPWRWYLTIGR